MSPRCLFQSPKAFKRQQEENFGRLSPAEGETREFKEVLKKNEKEHMSLLSPRPVALPSKKNYPSLLSVGIVGKRVNKEDKEKLCYNCGKKGHWFVDCLVRCGRCCGDGHRTMDCSIVSSKGGIVKLKEIKRELEGRVR